MIASLPMYDWPEVRAAHDRLWAAIADGLTARGIDAPARLNRDGELWDHWEAPELLLSQTCGLPYRARLRGRVRMVGAPDYGLEGCPPGYYASMIVVRAEDAAITPQDWPRRRFVYNENRSQSGWAALLNHAGRIGVGFASATASGAHRISARMVAEGAADIAAIDAQSWRMVTAYDPWADDLCVIGRTDPTPATPFITSRHMPVEAVSALRAALRDAVTELTPDDRACLHLRDVVDVPEAAYLCVPTPRG